jgi:hypothetical protein
MPERPHNRYSLLKPKGGFEAKVNEKLQLIIKNLLLVSKGVLHVPAPDWANRRGLGTAPYEHDPSNA